MTDHLGKAAWQFVGASLVGASHSKEGSPCQDSHAVRLLGEGGHGPFVACVADGAGSARHSALGSSAACQSIIELAISHFESHGAFAGLSKADALAWFREVRERIARDAQLAECSLRDFATTLCVAIVDDEAGYFFQIGDGAIVIKSNSASGVVFWPQSGEYANSTNFITSDVYYDRMEFCKADVRIGEVALLTDGLERLALKFDGKIPHLPFFNPLFPVLRAATDLEALGDDLRRFLESPSVQARSDDDKTLVLACRGPHEA